MLKKVGCLLFACGMGIGSAQAAVLVVDVSTGELLGAQGVTVGSQTYNVQFVEGTCAGLFSDCNDESDFTFTTLESAMQAAQALLDQVFLGDFDTQPELTLGCDYPVECFALTPFGSFIGDLVLMAAARNAPVEALDTNESLFGLPIDLDTSSDASVVFVLWEPGPAATPAPGVLSLLALGLLGLGWSRFRSK